jgi:hypothetical protein
VPSYLSFKDRANKSAAQANIRSVVPDIESYSADNYPGSSADPDGSTTDQGYSGLTPAILKSTYDQALNATKYTINAVTATNYCVFTKQGGWAAYKHGPSGVITAVADASGAFNACP